MTKFALRVKKKKNSLRGLTSNFYILSDKKNLKLLTCFCLPGGDEWKQLAESFGMSYNEIRLLDKRTFIPCDVVLDLIANHRYLVVGELYDKLVKSGLPGSADLL